jgi:phenylalanyl-tRNA synthetase alpha chain
MVDPNVLEATEIDSECDIVLAADLGIERLVILLYGIDNVRLFYENDLHFLDQI